MKNNYLRARKEILRFHNDAELYAIAVNKAIAEANGGVPPLPFSAGALYAMTADLLGMHRAVLSLCESGWAYTTVVVIRSMMDILLNALVVTEKVHEAEYRGFKYTHFFLKKKLRSSNLPEEQKKSLYTQIEGSILRMPVTLQPRVRDYIFKDPLCSYWYSPEYKNPSGVMNHLVRPDIRRIYDFFSGGSHGGFLGLRILKDDPDSIHPNPRPDPKSQDLAIGSSTRLLLETMYLRDIFENHDASHKIYNNLIKSLSTLLDSL